MQQERLHQELFLKTCALFGVDNSTDLLKRFTQRDQDLMYSSKWDYKDHQEVINKAKLFLEKIDPKHLSNEDGSVRQKILWLWYHHAISSAIWLYHDKKSARTFAEKAVEYQPANHPNRITRLFYFLTHNNIEEAETWARAITAEPEKSTAREIIKYFKENFLTEIKKH